MSSINGPAAGNAVENASLQADPAVTGDPARVSIDTEAPPQSSEQTAVIDGQANPSMLHTRLEKPSIARRVPNALHPTQLESSRLARQTNLANPLDSQLRSVSSPVTSAENSSLVQLFPRRRAPLSTAIHSNRVVSLPEGAALSAHFKFHSHPQAPSLPTVDELHPLTTLVSPDRLAVSDLSITATASPSGSMIVHTSFSSSENDASPPSTPGAEEAEFVVGSPSRGRSGSFFRTFFPASSKGSELESQTIETKIQAQNEPHPVDNEPKGPQPIPALHGPSSLPYARCPSGAEGIIISEQSSLPRMIWGLNEGRHGVPKTPVLSPPSVPIESYVVNTTATPYNAGSVANTPASTVIATPGSSMPQHRWYHPKTSYTSTQPYNKYKESMQAFDASHSNQNHYKADMRSWEDPRRHSKNVSTFSGKENIPLASPVQLREPFGTPGGYTEYRYADREGHENVGHWHEFQPTSAGADRRLVPVSSQTQAHFAPPTRPSLPSNPLQPAHSIHAPRAPQNIQLQPTFTPNLANSSASRPPATSQTPNAPNSNGHPLFAIRKTPSTQAPRPKLRELPSVANLFDETPGTSASGPAHTAAAPVTPLEAPPVGSDVYAAAALLQQMWNQQLMQFAAASAILSGGSQAQLHPQLAQLQGSSLWPFANSSIGLGAPPGLAPPTADASDRATPQAEDTEATSSVPVGQTIPAAQSPGPLRNARSVPLTRLRNRSQSQATANAASRDTELPAPVNDLAVGLEQLDVSDRPSKTVSRARASSQKADAGAGGSSASAGYTVMGGGIQAQGPTIAYADKVKNSSSGASKRRESSGGLGVVGVLSSMAPSAPSNSSRGGRGNGRRASSGSNSSRQPSIAGSGPGFQRGEAKANATVRGAVAPAVSAT